MTTAAKIVRALLLLAFVPLFLLGIEVWRHPRTATVLAVAAVYAAVLWWLWPAVGFEAANRWP